MLLVEININGTTHYISNDLYALTHCYDDYIISFTAPYWQTDEEYGGYMRLEIGEIVLRPELFDSDWPPPVQCEITIKHTSTTEEAAITIITGTLHLSEFNLYDLKYKIYSNKEIVNLLDEVIDYENNITPLPKAFGTVTHVNPVRLPDSGGKPLYSLGYIQGTLGTDYHVFDDGVDVCANFTDNLDNTITANVGIVGEITLTGTGLDTTLTDIFEWACGADYLDLTYDDTNSRTPSPDVVKWQTEQINVRDFLSQMSAFFTHMFYETTTHLYLIDMYATNGSSAKDGFDIFSIKYQNSPPLERLCASWVNRAYINDATGSHVKDYRKKLCSGLNIYATGAQDSVYGEELVDDSATFITDGILAGMLAKNLTTGAQTIVNQVVSETILDLEENVFAYEDTYEIGLCLPYGNRNKEIEPWHDAQSNIDVALDDILNIYSKANIEFEMPFDNIIPTPGEQITITDEETYISVTSVMTVNSIRFDFGNDEMTIAGKGTIS